MALRNCNGKGSPAKIVVNNQLYRRCPRAIYWENYWARYIVGVYLECRNSGTYPAPGGIQEQTQFTAEVFEFLDNIFGEARINQAKKAQNQSQATKVTKA